MRKLPVVLLLLLGLGLAAAWPIGDGYRCAKREAGHDPILAWMSLLPGDAEAQQLRFREVPPESAKRIDRTRARRAVVPPAVPETPGEPEAAQTPDTPEAPKLGSRSGDIVRIGHDVHVEADEVVEGDLVVMGSDIVVDGHVEGDVVAMGGDVQLNATARVDGDVACIGGHLSQEDGAVIGGQRFTATGFRDFARQRARAEREEEAEERSHHLVASLVKLLVMVAIAWGFAALAPGRTQAALETLKRQPAASIGVGALVFALIIPSLVALALIIVILCITIIGIPLALAALFGYVLFLILMYVWGFAVVSSWLGERVLARRNAQVAGAGIAASAPPTLVRAAVTGALILLGGRFVGELLKTAPPLHGLGVFLIVISWAAFAIGVTFGGGAWLRNEFTSGVIGRVWRGRRGGGAMPATPTQAPPPATHGGPSATPPTYGGTPPASPPATYGGTPPAEPTSPTS